MTTTTVPVTADHIAKGKPSDCAGCPVALAILDAVPAAWHAEVWWAYGDAEDENGASATIWLARGTLTQRLGEDADMFVSAFDAGEAAEPFTLTMTIPDGAS